MVTVDEMLIPVDAHIGGWSSHAGLLLKEHPFFFLAASWASWQGLFRC